MIAGEIPNDADGPKVIGLPQMQDLFDDLRWRPILRILWNRLLIDQSRFTIIFMEHLPAVKAGSGNPKISAGFNSAANVFCMFENAQFALNIAFVLVHPDHPPAQIGS